MSSPMQDKSLTLQGSKCADFVEVSKTKDQQSSEVQATRIKNMVIVPVLEEGDTLSYKTYRSTLIGHWADDLGISVPAIIKEMPCSKTAIEAQSWSERMHFMARKLVDLDSTNCPEVFGMPLSTRYRPAFVVGNAKNRVMFLHTDLFEKAKALVDCPENLNSYGRSLISNEFRTNGLWSLSGLRVEIAVDDNFRPGLKLDGLGYMSEKLQKMLRCKASVVQFRACFNNSGDNALVQQGVFKGILQYCPTVDMKGKDLILPPSTLKGCSDELSLCLNTPTSLLLGVLKTFGRPLKSKSSWTWLEAPTHKCVKEAEIPLAEKRAHELMDIINSPAKALDFKGLLDRDNGSMSKLEQMLKVAVGSKVSDDRPSLLSHPYIALGLRDLHANALRSLSVNGAREWDYLVGTGEITTGEAEGRAIRCNTHKPGDLLVVRRFPVCLRDSWGICMGPTEGNQCIQLGSAIVKDLAGDFDGDFYSILKCDRRLVITRKERAEGEYKAPVKSKVRRRSTWFETVNSICSSLGGNQIGSITMGMLSCEFAGRHDKAITHAYTLQSALDAQKFQVSFSSKEARSDLEEYGLPLHICQRNNSKQFRSPETTDIHLGDETWARVAAIYKNRLKEQNVNSLSQYSHLFGVRSHGLNRGEYRELEDVYRHYIRSVRSISGIDDSTTRDEKMKEIYDQCRFWTASKGEDDRWMYGAWMLVHSTGGPQNRGVWLFETFGVRLLEALAKVYESEELARLKDWEIDNDVDELDFKQWTKLPDGIKGKLVRTGDPLELGYAGHGELIAHQRCAGPLEPGLVSIALVNLEHLNPAKLAEAIEAGAFELIKDKQRHLPAIKEHGLNVVVGGKKVAEIADEHVPLALKLGLTKGSALAYRKSVKVVIPVGELAG